MSATTGATVDDPPTTRIDSLEDASGYVLSDARRDRLLREQLECTFCWTSREGQPVGVTQSFLYSDDVIWMCSEESRVRVRAVRRDPRTAVVVSAPGRSKTISYVGRSEIVTDRDRILWFLREVAARYDPDDPQAQQAHVAAADTPGRVLIRFTPDRVTNAFDGGLARHTT